MSIGSILAAEIPPGDPWLPAGLAVPAIAISVFRLASGTLQALPSLFCCSVQQAEGPEPGSAKFRYRWDGNSNSPQNLEQALSTAFGGSQVIEPGDRLVCYAGLPTGGTVPFFDGEAVEFSGGLSGNSEYAYIGAVGIAYHAFDVPLAGQMMRTGSDWTVVNDLQTDIPGHFNKAGPPKFSNKFSGNATPAGPLPHAADRVWATGKSSPTFVDPLIVKTDDGARPWTLPMAGRYICYSANFAETYVKCPDDALFDILYSREPIDAVSFDPADPATYTNKPIVVPDKPFTGKGFPDELHTLIHDKGYSMAWRLTAGSGGLPSTKLDLYCAQTKPVKDLGLQARGDTLDPAASNVGSIELGRNLSSVVNSVRVIGHDQQFEGSFILLPGFAAAAADGTSAGGNIETFNRNDPAFASVYNQYRLYLFDEAGEGHYSTAGGSKYTTIPNLMPVLGDDGHGNPIHVTRHRPPIGQLFSKDPRGKRLKWNLSISTDYVPSDFTTPEVWTGAGTWQDIGHQGYELLHDRIGIWISCENPDNWKIGASDAASAPFVDGVVHGVADQSLFNPGTMFYLRLTVVIEGDQAVSGLAGRKSSSPMPQDIVRDVDARDRFYSQVIRNNSQYNTTGSDITFRDDSDNALAEAVALRYAAQSGVMEAEVMIPRFTLYWDLGDRISQIAGRNIPLRTDGGGTDNAAVYPTVVARRWDFENGQQTYLTLSDASKGRKRFERGPKRAEPPDSKGLARSKVARQDRDFVNRQDSKNFIGGDKAGTQPGKPTSLVTYSAMHPEIPT